VWSAVSSLAVILQWDWGVSRGGFAHGCCGATGTGTWARGGCYRGTPRDLGHLADLLLGVALEGEPL